jgi:hypothetical protein
MSGQRTNSMVGIEVINIDLKEFGSIFHKFFVMLYKEDEESHLSIPIASLYQNFNCIFCHLQDKSTIEFCSIFYQEALFLRLLLRLW